MFNDYWQRLEKSTPALRKTDTNMHISVQSFRDCVERAFEAGAEHQKGLHKLHKAAGEFDTIGKKSAGPLGNLFGDLEGLFK
jgi:hypothetical protein